MLPKAVLSYSTNLRHGIQQPVVVWLPACIQDIDARKLEELQGQYGGCLILSGEIADGPIRFRVEMNATQSQRLVGLVADLSRRIHKTLGITVICQNCRKPEDVESVFNNPR